MKKMEDMENRNNHKNQKTDITVKTASAIFSESLKCLKSLMQIFVESAESAKSAKSIFATFASAIFVGKASCESTVRYRERSRIPSCLFRLSLGSNLSRFSLASLICLCMLTVGVGNAWGVDVQCTLSNANILAAGDPASSYSSWSFTDGCSQTWSAYCIKNKQSNADAAYNFIQIKAYASRTAHYLQVPAKSGYTIKSITMVVSSTSVVHNGGGNTAIYYFSSSKNSTTAASGLSANPATAVSGTGASSVTLNCSSLGLTTGYITASAGTRMWGDIVVTYTPAASCSADPTIGTASVNSSFTLTSLTDAVSVSSGTCGAGSDCAWTDYGFVWSLGSTTTTPTVSNNKVQIGTSGTATSWATDASHKVQPSGSTTPISWAVGSTYYIRTYGKNGKESATFQYGTAASFTLRSITFTSNGGSSVGPWYVNSGGTYSAPTAPTKTGYDFGGWYTDNSTFESAVDWTASVSENKTYYAKWTAKVYRITLDNESPTTSGSTYVDLTYNSSSHTGIINPKKTGYTFGGYWTGDNGTGTLVINTSGELQANVTNYTGADGIWTKAATTTLYAKWTINNYSVTWMVNGTEWSGKGGSTNANYNTAWSALTLPTAPTTSDGCGQKFVGWTTTENYSNATTAPTDLLNAGNKSGKTAVLITDDVVFHAVFADYDE